MSGFIDGNVLSGANQDERCPEDLAWRLPILRKTLFEHHKPEHTAAIRLGLAYILAHPEMDWRDLGAEYEGGWYDGDIYELVEYLYKTLWPDKYPIPPEDLRDIEVEPEDA